MNFKHMLCQTAQRDVFEIAITFTTDSVDRCVILHTMIVAHMLNKVVLALESACTTIRSAVRTRVGRSLSLMDQLMPLQVLDLNAFCAATRESTHESSMSSVLAMVGKLPNEVEAKLTLCTGVVANIWMLFIEMLRDID